MQEDLVGALAAASPRIGGPAFHFLGNGLESAGEPDFERRNFHVQKHW
jgi:hypothetical protein